MTTKRKLTRDDLLNAGSQRVIEPVEIPELGGIVYVQGLTSAERDRYEQSVMQRRGGQLIPNLTNARAKLIMMTLVDEDGSVLFTEEELGILGNIQARTLQRIWNKAADLSGITEEDVDALEKDFGSAPRDGSSSDSPGISDSQQPSSARSSAAGN